MINTSELTSRFYKGETVNLEFQYPSESIFIAVNSLVSKILSRMDRIFLFDMLVTVLREIILNAVKANEKRLFFKKKGLNINDEKDYKKGMAKFKNIVSDYKFIQTELSDSDLKINMKFKMSNKGIEVEVSNNIKILPTELQRINWRIKNGIECNNFADAYENVYDPSEGAGLGIILIILLLKNAGIDTDFFQIIPGDESVNTTLMIPYDLRETNTISTIKEKIIEEVNTLPTFPENIIELQSLCNKPDVSIDAISTKISHDPSLTADVLKIANSAGFITSKRIDNINEAIMIIGLKNFHTILATTATRKILDKRYKKFEQIWTHSNKTAHYAKFIAIEMDQSKIAGNIFIAGLLHDIGKIVLLATDLKLVNQISDLVDNRKIRSSTILEEVAIGISHSTIGAMIAERWNFPDDLVEAIKHHHSPLNAVDTYKDIVIAVYLANFFCKIEKQNFGISYVETEVLEKLNINNENDLLKLHKKLKTKYDNHFSTVKD